MSSNRRIVLQAALGTGKGTCDLVDWQKADCLIVMGVNAA